jgi:hypothetical protein
MSPEKLEALRKLALDERTPVEEARTAALTFVRKGGRAEPDEKTRQQRAELEEERDQAKADAQKQKTEADRLRLLLGKMLALIDAETKLGKNRAEVEEEVRRAVGQEPPRPPVASNPPPRRPPYVPYGWNDPYYSRGGF